MAKKQSGGTPKNTVSRKTNEEIDIDERGDFIIHGEDNAVAQQDSTESDTSSHAGKFKGIED